MTMRNTLAAKRALAAGKVDLWITTVIGDNDILRAGARTLVATGAKIEKLFILERPGRAQRRPLVAEISTQELPSTDTLGHIRAACVLRMTIEHTPPRGYDLGQIVIIGRRDWIFFWQHKPER